MRIENARGLELLVLSGGLRIGADQFEPQSWLRLPAGESLDAEIGSGGARVWLKDAPLMHPDVIPIPDA